MEHSCKSAVSRWIQDMIKSPHLVYLLNWLKILKDLVMWCKCRKSATHPFRWSNRKRTGRWSEDEQLREWYTKTISPPLSFDIKGVLHYALVLVDDFYVRVVEHFGHAIQQKQYRKCSHNCILQYDNALVLTSLKAWWFLEKNQINCHLASILIRSHNCWLLGSS